MSLANPAFFAPVLAPGHPFILSDTAPGYWTGTTDANNPDAAWELIASDGHVSLEGKTQTNIGWCVRGGGPLGVY